MRISQRVAGVVAQRPPFQIDDGTPGGFQDGLPRGRIPFEGVSEPRIQVGRALCDQTELQCAANRQEFVGPEPGKEVIQRRAAMRTAACNHGPGPGGRLNLNGPSFATLAPPGTLAGDAAVRQVQGRGHDEAKHGLMVFDEGNVDRELPVALDEFPSAIEWIHEPEPTPVSADGELVLIGRRLLGQHRDVRCKTAEACRNRTVGSLVCCRQGRGVGLFLYRKISGIDLEDGMRGILADGQDIIEQRGQGRGRQFGAAPGPEGRRVSYPQPRHPQRLPLNTPDWSRIDTVLLDMDGTLLDLRFDNYFWRELVPERFARLRGISLAEARAELMPRFAARQGTLEWYCTDFWTREIGFDVAGLKHEVRESIRFLPGAVDFLEAVRANGRRLVLVTNAHHDSLRIKAAQTGLAAYFDVLLSSHSFGYPKEHPQFWHALEAKYPHDPMEALFVDDSLPVLEAARTHGVGQMFAIARPDSTEPPRSVTGFSAVHSVADLLPGAWPERLDRPVLAGSSAGG